jgi:hypothetical protein
MRQTETPKQINLCSNEPKLLNHIRPSKDSRDDFYEREKRLKRDEYYFNLQDKLKYNY